MYSLKAKVADVENLRQHMAMDLQRFYRGVIAPLLSRRGNPLGKNNVILRPREMIF